MGMWTRDLDVGMWTRGLDVGMWTRGLDEGMWTLVGSFNALRYKFVF